MNATVLAALALVLLASCGPRSGPDVGANLPDSAQLVQVALASLDSNRGSADTLALAVREFRRESSYVVIVFTPVSAAVQGGGGHVRLDSTGRTLFVRAFQ